MAAWELALIIFAVTYLMVNTVYLIIQVKMLKQMSGMLTKSYKVCEKIIDYSEKHIDDLFKDEL